MSLVSSDGFILSSDKKIISSLSGDLYIKFQSSKDFHFYEIIKEFCIGLLMALGFRLPNKFHAINKDEICLIPDD